MKRSARIMLIEDNVAYREAVVTVIDNAVGMEVASHYGTAEIAFRNLQQAGLHNHPDIILLDLHLPGMPGFKALAWIRKYSPDVKIIVLTQLNNPAYVKEALSQGASGHLLKSATHKQIIQSIQDVVKGGFSVDPKMAKQILVAVQGKKNLVDRYLIAKQKYLSCLPKVLKKRKLQVFWR